jgi:hypothetical protein
MSFKQEEFDSPSDQERIEALEKTVRILLENLATLRRRQYDHRTEQIQLAMIAEMHQKAIMNTQINTFLICFIFFIFQILYQKLIKN